MAALWCCLRGRGLRGNSAACSALCWFSVTPSTTHKQTGPFWCWFLSGWVCVHSRTLWISPTNSCESGSLSHLCNPPHVFTVRGFEALFPLLEPWFAWYVSFPSCSSWFICTWMWNRPVCQPPPCLPRPSSRCLAVSPLCLAACLCPSYWSG